MPNIPEIKCSQCGGKGTHPLSAGMLRTLQTVRKLRRASAEDVARALGWSGNVTAICNRLRSLYDLGFLTRGRKVRTLIYSIK